MGDDIEIHLRGGKPKKWHSGKTRIEDGPVTVTAPDGRTKSAQLGGKSPELMARLLLLCPSKLRRIGSARLLLQTRHCFFNASHKRATASSAVA